MIKVVGNVSTGKTGRLLLLAKEHNGIVVCKNPAKMMDRAHSYGLTGIDFMSYEEYIENIRKPENNSRYIYIDNLSDFLIAFDTNILGYTETI